MITHKLVSNRIFQCTAWLCIMLAALLSVSTTRSSAQETPPFISTHTARTLPAAPDAIGQNPDSGVNLQEATNTLLRLNSELQAAPASQKAAALDDLRLALLQRQQRLAALMESDPAGVLRLAIPNEIRATLPTELQSLLEQQVDLEGILEVLIEDSDRGARLHHVLEVAGERVELHFASPPPDLLSGSRVRVRGVRFGLALAVDPIESTNKSSLRVAAAPLPNTFGEQKTLVILVNFQDAPTQPYTTAQAYDVVFNQTSNFDMENSFQQTWLTGDVYGWFTIPVLSTNCDTNSIATYAEQAATAAGANLSAYPRRVYAFPTNSGCGWWGLGNVGGSPTHAWINGSFALKVVGHEMGHNFGLYHSHAWYCGGTTLGSNCSSIEYGDTVDIMGNPSSCEFNAFQKERLGWLNYGIAPPIQTVQSSGTYTIGPLENHDGTPKALKILQSTNPTTGLRTWYYVEYRQAIGADSVLSNDPNVLNGVVVHTGTDSTGDSSELLNMAPALNSFSTPALEVGQSFIDVASGITIQTVSATSTAATVSVTFGIPACAHANPTVSISPSQSQSVQAGTAVTYTVSVVNNDNAGCSSAAFSLSASTPTGWSTAFGNSILTLFPGTSASTSLQVTSPTSAGSGLYNVSVTGNNTSTSGYSGSASATYVLNTTPCIHANPTVSLSPSQSQSVQPGTAVMYTLKVVNNDNSVCTSTKFNLGDSVPTGWTAALGISALTLAPGGSAATSLQVTSPANAAGGSYGVAATATSSSSSGYSGTASSTYVIAGGSTCTLANPGVTISPTQSGSTPGGAVSYSVSVRDNDSAGCTSTTINLSAAVPSGWSASLANSSLALSPGGSGSTTLQVTSPTSAPTGSYNITVTAVNGGAGGTSSPSGTYSGAASATYVVSVPQQLTMTLAANAATYTANQTVTLTAKVTSGSSPVSGASVSFTIVKADGSSVVLSSTTGTTGSAVAKYKVNRKDPHGTYTATAKTTTSSGSAQATATFVVQ